MTGSRMPEIVLYHSPFSTCSQKVRHALALKGLEYRSRIVDLPALEHLEDAYLAVNPDGLVPALTHDGGTVTDSSVICEYLEEAFAERPIAPRDAAGRARMRSWMRYLEEVVTPAVRPLSFNAVFVKGIAALTDDRRAWMLERTPMRRQFYRRLGTRGFGAADVEDAEECLLAGFDRAETSLASSGAFLVGDAVTIADLTLLPSVIRLQDLGRSDLMNGRPCIDAWLRRMTSDPTFAAAYPEHARLRTRASGAT